MERICKVQIFHWRECRWLVLVEPTSKELILTCKQRGISGNYLTAYAASGGILDPDDK